MYVYIVSALCVVTPVIAKLTLGPHHTHILLAADIIHECIGLILDNIVFLQLCIIIEEEA